VPQQPAKPGIRALEAFALTIFLVTAVLLTGLLVLGLGTVFSSPRTAAAWFSTLCAVAAAVLMLIDAVDLWVRGRTMTPRGVKLLRSLVFVVVLGALVVSLVGGNALVVPLLAPAIIAYLFIARRRPAGSARVRGTARAGSGGSGATSSSAKSRQRRGGKKRR